MLLRIIERIDVRWIYTIRIEGRGAERRYIASMADWRVLDISLLVFGLDMTRDIHILSSLELNWQSLAVFFSELTRIMNNFVYLDFYTFM